MKQFLLLFSVWFLAFNSTSQNNLDYLDYVFPIDSISGFDENLANHKALHHFYFGTEYKVIMYKQKRDYINKKYGYSNGVAFVNENLTAKNDPVIPKILGAPCNNEDFEASAATTLTTTAAAVGTTLAGWTVSQGQNSGFNSSCTMVGCCSTAGSTNAWIRSTPWTDPNAGVLGVIGASPLGGTKILQMNDNIPIQGEMVQIQQTFPVTSANAMFQMAYLASLNGSAHACCDQPFMTIKVVDCFNTPLACPSLSVTPPGAACVATNPSGWTTNASGVSYTTAWQRYSLDLTAYIGSCITVQIMVSDCNGWAHHGMCYVDFLCSPMNVQVNTVSFPAGPPVVAVTACGVTTASISAPPGMGPYLWNGPAGSGVTNNANQTFTTTVAGNYTLSMTPPGICAPITKTISLSFGTFPNGGFTRNNSCTTYTFTNTGAASPAVQTYSIVGPGAPPTYTTTSPTSVVNLAPSTTYTIYQTVTNAAGCPTTTSVVITTPAGPNPAFTAASSFTQCLSGNAFTFNATTAAGTHTYNFIPTTGAPASGFTNPYGPVSFTSPGTYTVLHTNISSGCTVATTSVVVINQTPTVTALTGTAPPCAWASATLVASGGPGSITWAGPGGFSAIGSTVTIPSFQTTNQGIYTVTINNNGCSATRTINLQMSQQPTITITNTGPYCIGATAQYSLAISAGSSLYWGSYWYNSAWTWWAGGQNANPIIIPNVQLSSSGVYYFNANFTNGCYAYAQMTVTVNNCFLPIELTSFEGTCVNNLVNLDWETSMEKNNKYFSILRSEDGINFELINVQNGAGNSNVNKKYNYIDKTAEPGRTYYYKLRQTDVTNEETDVGSMVTLVCSKKNYTLEMFPNPSSNEMFLISEKDLSNAEIQILNEFGQKVKIIPNVNLKKDQRFAIDIRDVINGCYELVITSQETHIQKKFVTYK